MGVVISALAAAFTQFNALTWDGHPRLAALYGMMALVIGGDAGWRARKLWESEQTVRSSRFAKGSSYGPSAGAVKSAHRNLYFPS
jgi:hypothetical protein